MIELIYHGQPIAFQRPRYDSRNHRSFNSTRYSNAKKAMADFIRTNAPGAYFDCPLRLLVNFYRQRFEHYGHGTKKQAIVGLGGQAYIAKNSQQAKAEFRPYFDDAPVYGNGPSLEEFSDLTPLTVGSPQEVIEKTLTFREYFGDYQRQLFLVDHAGMPLPMVLKQIDLLGSEVVPVLRQELAAKREPEVAEAPTHAGRVKAKYGDAEPRQPRPNANRGDNVTGRSPYQDSDAVQPVG